MSTDAIPEFAITWTWLRDPSPPVVPVAGCVSFALISCLTWYSSKYNSYTILGYQTLVTVVPAKKKTASNAKKTLQGCIACTTAVAKAVRMPTGVNDLRDQARYTSAAIAGTAIYGFMVGLLDVCGALGGVLRHRLGISAVHQHYGSYLALSPFFRTQSPRPIVAQISLYKTYPIMPAWL
jgi:hypothetical protein